jgi:hypothetical protein
MRPITRYPITDPLRDELVHPETIQSAFIWCCNQRLLWHHNTDIWHLRFHWTTLKSKLLSALHTRSFQFDPRNRQTRSSSKHTVISAQDAIVLKAMASVISPLVRRRIRHECIHLAGRGGAKAAVRAVHARIANYSFILKADVNSYYARISHSLIRTEIRRISRSRYLSHLIDLWLAQPKTWLGRTDRGIDFLGYHIRPHHPLTPSAATQANHTNILIGKLDSGDWEAVDRYVTHWRRWARAGLPHVVLPES